MAELYWVKYKKQGRKDWEVITIAESIRGCFHVPGEASFKLMKEVEVLGGPLEIPEDAMSVEALVLWVMNTEREATHMFRLGVAMSLKPSKAEEIKRLATLPEDCFKGETKDESN